MTGNYKEVIDGLRVSQDASSEVLLELIGCEDKEIQDYLFRSADEVRQEVYGRKVFIRGLIEISNYCKNDCYYCGIRRGNGELERYRLEPKDVAECCDEGYELGFRTFVMQGGEDSQFSDEMICEAVREIKRRHPDTAVTLSVGEKSREVYKSYREAGADRYLLRHETAVKEHYEKLHPENMSFENRRECLFTLKELGFQVGAGIMVGSPYQKDEYIVEDLRFMQELRPHMIGIGPFLPHHQTPFAKMQAGSFEKTLNVLAVLRLMFPKVLLPSTTALGTIRDGGREMGLRAGANVIMPNLSPEHVRKMYQLYDNKLSTGAESAQKLELLKKQVADAGYEIITDRGDYIDMKN